MGRSGGGGGGFSGGGGGFSGGGGFGGGFSGGGGFGGGFSGGNSSGGRSSAPDFGGGSGHGGSGGGLGGFPLWPLVLMSRSGGGGGSNGSNNNRNSGGGSNGGCLGGAAGCLVAVILAMVLLAVLGSVASCTVCAPFDTVPSGSAVTASTVEREKLANVDYGADEGYFSDIDGDWIHNPAQLEAGLKQFFKDTGVQPYVYILPNGQETSPSELGKMAEQLYNQLFDDGAHFLLVFCDNGQGGFNCGYYVGPEAKTVMDAEAVQILGNYLDRYYSEAPTEEEVFSDAFAETGKRIMTVQKSPVPYIVGGVVVVALAGVAVFAIKKRSDAKEAERRHKEEVLKTPLEKFGDASVDDLAKKYMGDDASAEDLANKYDK